MKQTHNGSRFKQNMWKSGENKSKRFRNHVNKHLGLIFTSFKFCMPIYYCKQRYLYVVLLFLFYIQLQYKNEN